MPFNFQKNMAPIVRKSQPECFRYFLKILRFPNTDYEGSNNCGREESCSVDNLVDVLMLKGNYSINTAKEAVANAIRDGLLVPITTSVSSPRSSRSVGQEHKRIRLPNSQEVNVASSHDLYCYECHLPGMLEQCRQCWRSFHRLCYRRNPERPNYAIPSSKQQKNRLPAFSSETESDSDEIDTVHCSTVLDYESDIRVNSSLMQADQTSIASWTPQHQSGIVDEIFNIDSSSSPPFPLAVGKESATAAGNNNMEGKPLLADLESKTKMEVVCMGEIRPPNRQRPNTTASSISYKSEISPNDEDEHDMELCTCCRLLKRADLRNPANLKADELCHLVNFTYTYNREWLAYDVRAYLDSKRLNEQEINIISSLLLHHSPIKRLDNVADKLKTMQYSLLMQFLVDLLDIQHTVGVFFGSYSTEMESTKWLLRDIMHDLSEIRRCADCFRYSHEKQSNIWFAKPCVQRHELVYAKHSGFPYWPAKVIRVLPNHKFDVRFFGGNHSRALIDVRFIKSIDADIKSLKMGNSPGIKKAMDELRYHQMLATYPPSKFSFHADPRETEEIIRTVLGSSASEDNVMGKAAKKNSMGRKRKISSSANKDNKRAKANANDVNLSQEENEDQNILSNSQTSQCTEVAVSLKRLKTKHLNNNKNNTKKDEENNNNNSNKRTTRKTNKSTDHDERSNMLKELDEARKMINEFKQKNEKLEIQKQKLKDAIKKQELERKIMKRKQWCYWCLDEAIYLCCFRAAYCSEICQARHWKDGHSKVCKNQSESKKS